METAQDKFNVAKKSYEKAIKCIDAIAEICQKAQPVEKQDLQSQFDIILQVFLLRCSVSNGHLSNTECQFIEHLVENSDLLTCINLNFETSLTWDGVATSGIGQIDMFLEKVLSTNIDLVFCLFPYVIAVSEAINSQLWDTIVDEVTNICNIFMRVEDNEENEVSDEVAQNFVEKFFTRYYITYRERLFQIRGSNKDEHTIVANFDKLLGNPKYLKKSSVPKKKYRVFGIDFTNGATVLTIDVEADNPEDAKALALSSWKNIGHPNATINSDLPGFNTVQEIH